LGGRSPSNPFLRELPPHFEELGTIVESENEASIGSSTPTGVPFLTKV